jgi:hypothetical protein
MRESRTCTLSQTCLKLAVIFLCAMWARAQGTALTDPSISDPPVSDVQQLKDKLALLEQSIKEVKGQITALEAQHAVLDAVVMSKSPTPAAAQDAKKSSGAERTIELYGFIMMDSGYDFGQNDPLWLDTMRPTKLPSYKNQFGYDGNVYFGVRQTRFGVKTSTPTAMGI